MKTNKLTGKAASGRPVLKGMANKLTTQPVFIDDTFTKPTSVSVDYQPTWASATNPISTYVDPYRYMTQWGHLNAKSGVIRDPKVYAAQYNSESKKSFLIAQVKEKMHLMFTEAVNSYRSIICIYVNEELETTSIAVGTPIVEEVISHMASMKFIVTYETHTPTAADKEVWTHKWIIRL